MSIVRNFNLYLNAGNGSAPYINVNQYDQGEQWVFTLYKEDGTKYLPSTGAIVGIKADNRGIINTGTVDADGRVVINETQQMTAAAGIAIFELLIDGDSHGTANFLVNVEQRPGDNADLSDSDLSLIQQAVDAATTIEDLIEGHDPDEVIADAVDAWLDAHPEATTTVEDGAITSAKLNDSVKTGVFEDMTVGTSLAVMNDEGTTDNLAYKFRQTGGDAVRELDEVHGGTIAFNQLVQNGDFASTSNWVETSTTTFTVSDNVASLAFAVDATPRISQSIGAVPIGHKLLLMVDFKQSVQGSDQIRFGVSSGAAGGTASKLISLSNIPANTWTTLSWIRDQTTSLGHTFLGMTGTSTISTADTWQIRNYMAFDLTQMFGSTVADAIYATEQSSAGSGVAYFRSLFPNSYYAYNAGELVSVEGLSAHETTGFNQWDEEWELGSINTNTGTNTNSSTNIRSKNYIHVLPNTSYYFNVPYTTGTGGVYYYDSNHNYISYELLLRASLKTTPSNAQYMKFVLASSYGTTYNHDICINFSSSENGTYKPYQKHTYPLDSTLTLRGVPKWNNGLYYDGDIYRHDGSVQRRYGTRAYQSGDESLTDAITDGTNTVYKLTTPTSETADPYQQYQICDGKGTEEYVSTTVTPVGHNTFYPVDIVSKVNKLPSDFSTLIAPTEEGFKATRNYTAKQFLIVNNQLYRVTANIANGANIVPNTNVTAVTIADILTTLI